MVNCPACILTDASGERFPFFQYVALVRLEFEPGRYPDMVADLIAVSFRTSFLKAIDWLAEILETSTVITWFLLYPSLKLPDEMHLIVYSNGPGDQDS